MDFEFKYIKLKTPFYGLETKKLIPFYLLAEYIWIFLKKLIILIDKNISKILKMFNSIFKRIFITFLMRCYLKILIIILFRKKFSNKFYKKKRYVWHELSD